LKFLSFNNLIIKENTEQAAFFVVQASFLSISVSAMYIIKTFVERTESGAEHYGEK